MTDNMRIWNRYADIDPKFTKPITGRDYSGTSPNPQYVVRCLTEIFGPVGKGFGWEVLAEAFTDLGGTHLHWCRIRFWWRDADGVCDFEQYGQTKAAYTTLKGTMRVDEDAPKKSLTDAIVKAASHLGIAANIFLGRWDDSKYVASVNEEYREKERAPGITTQADAIAAITSAATVGTLNAAWRAMSPDLHKDQSIIEAAKARKAEITERNAA